MTEELIVRAERQSRSTLLLVATDVGEPMYASLGFRRSHVYRFYNAIERQDRPLSSGLRPLVASDAKAVLELDRCATGEDRRDLLASSRWRGWACVDSGRQQIRGFFLPNLGQGTIVARDAEAGIVLMAVRQSTTDVRPVIPQATTQPMNS